MRARVNEAIEPLRAAGRIGKSLDSAVTLLVPPGDPMGEVLARNLPSLPELFIVSDVKIETTAEPGGPLGVSVRPCSELGHLRCPRCWRWLPNLVQSPVAEVCDRCAEALKASL
jgi:isoleucyl-tRNA synthetase